MAMPFIFERMNNGSQPERARRRLGATIRGIIEFASFAIIALGVLMAIGAIRVLAYLH